MKHRLIGLSLLATLCASCADHEQNHDEQQIVQIFRELDSARLKKDVETYQRYLANDCTVVTSVGTVLSKTELLNGIPAENLTALVSDNVKVRLYGDTAVVTLRATFSGKYAGQEFNNRQVLGTYTLVRRNGLWQIVATQGTSVPARAPA